MNSTQITQCGFEGPEKLLEIWFTSPKQPNGESYINDSDNSSIHSTSSTSTSSEKGLLSIDKSSWQLMLDLVYPFHSSESSMFVYPLKLVLKTCGTTTLLLSVPKILEIAKSLGLIVDAVFYSRKAFLFPEKQVFPHGNWTDEVDYLDNLFPSHSYDTSGYVVGKINGDHWCLYTVNPITPLLDADGDVLDSSESDTMTFEDEFDDVEDITIDIMMHKLDSSVTNLFWRRDGEANTSNNSFRDIFDVTRIPKACDPSNCEINEIGFPTLDLLSLPRSGERRILKETGIRDIYPDSEVDDFLFDPCGYSLNGILGSYYYTIHVTPEDICSYASFETTIPVRKGTVGYSSVEEVVSAVVQKFKPGKISVAVVSRGHCKSLLKIGHLKGFKQRDLISQSLGKWDLVYAHYDGRK